MEGCRRGTVWVAAVLVGCALIAGASGCGDDDSSVPPGVRTANPEQTFAPLIQLAADEPWRPMDARWFIERSSLWAAQDWDCPDRIIAVGRTMPERQNAETNWLYANGLGAQKSRPYYRVPNGPDCEMDNSRRVFADQLVRPYDPGPRTPEGARRNEGFYLDLEDYARVGEALGPGRTVTAPVFAERTDEGDGAVRLTYWALFGMHGVPGAPGAHEGDWQRMDVLLQDNGDDIYEPRAVQFDGLASTEVPWSETERRDGGHPVVTAARATHTLTPARRGEPCDRCLDWATWRNISAARDRTWYGFGGAWGDIGTNSATTGPLGPHGFFPSDAEKHREGIGY